MYSTRMQELVRGLGIGVDAEEASLSLLDDFFACFVGALGSAMDADVRPYKDPLDTSLRLMMLSRGLARSEPSANLDGAHYVVGMGLEQTGYLVARGRVGQPVEVVSPLEDDDWYRFTLSFLHYLAGGYRVQALSVLRLLQRISVDRDRRQSRAGYAQFYRALASLHAGRFNEEETVDRNVWRLLFSPDNGVQQWPSDEQHSRVSRLAQHVHRRRDVVLSALGRDGVEPWLASRGVQHVDDFWMQYLKRLESRGVSTFTPEQVGEGFDVWLRNEKDLVVVLPTGSGKTIVGELRTALVLANQRQVVWILPTRALVRQVKRDLQRAFDSLEVVIEELPTTEDFDPLFQDVDFSERHVSVTTPEKLAALLRVNPSALRGVGLVVFDEAQLLLETSRGPVAEFVLQKARQVDGCRLVLMTAFLEAQSSLEMVIEKLGGEFNRLISDVRPTRRTYGVVESFPYGSYRRVGVALYPPGVQGEDDVTRLDVGLDLRTAKYRSRPNALRNAVHVARCAARGGLRTVLFVRDRRSTEAQADRIAKFIRKVVKLPPGDVGRMKVELGRNSAVLGGATRGVLPHHAGLSPLEQHIAEKWVRDGLISAVVATPTLAQGVNLPFDLSVVSYTSRFDDRFNEMRELPQSEVMNMLGRAGRAGYVSDGVCLLAVENSGYVRDGSLDSARKWFFRHQDSAVKHLGLAGLMVRADNAQVGRVGWMEELDGLSFGEAQVVLGYAGAAAVADEEPQAYLERELMGMPSVSQVQVEAVLQFVQSLSALSLQLRRELGGDSVLASVFVRTGMPLSVLKVFLAALREYRGMDQEGEVFQWADQIVYDALADGQGRSWYSGLLEKVSLESVLAGVVAWRRGETLDVVEREFNLSSRDANNRMAVGAFFSRKLSIVSQFWGALALCDAALEGQVDRGFGGVLKQLPVFVREGVSSMGQLLCHRALGGVDRVLAHRVADVVDADGGGGSLKLRRTRIMGRLRRWSVGEDLIRASFGAVEAEALESVLQELFGQ
ncbi:DEAD/DEAH box helicase [Corallococcus sp. RDP092CA]|uniref:DEAD/DEAH box helicase n=1 Tax=Corallococcus sp. RDP092CA TaxID=3109369 RepID=UPI0035B096BF